MLALLASCLSKGKASRRSAATFGLYSLTACDGYPYSHKHAATVAPEKRELGETPAEAGRRWLPIWDRPSASLSFWHRLQNVR